MRFAFQMIRRLNKDDEATVHLQAHLLQTDDSVLLNKPLGKPTEIGKSDLDNLPHSSQLFCLGIRHRQQMQEMVEGCTRVL